MDIRDELQANANRAKNKKSVAICGTAGFGNSNEIAKLNPDVKNYIVNELASYPILIGDCPSGIDKLVQDTLKECNAKDVTVYSSLKNPRYIADSSFKIKHVPASGTGRAFHTSKDIAMINDAACLLAIWDGYSHETGRNIEQALSQNKHSMVWHTDASVVIPLRGKAVVYRSTDEFHRTIQTRDVDKRFADIPYTVEATTNDANDFSL